jgi:hypothetical protein
MLDKRSIIRSAALVGLCLIGIEHNALALTTVYVCKSATGTTYYTDTQCQSATGSSSTIKVYSSKSTTTSPTTNTTTALFTDSVFAPTSFWYTPIPLNVTLNSNNANYVTEFLRQKAAYFGNVTVNTYNYSSPVYFANANTPKQDVGFNDCQHKGYFGSILKQMFKQMEIPSYASPSTGTDHEASFYDPSSHSLWETWVSTKDATGKWSACWGGEISYTNTSSGIFQQGYGTTATGLPFIGGQITAEELARGEIKHAIGIALVDVESNWVYSWPANRSDGYNPTKAPNRIPEGLRFRLDPAVNVSGLSMSTTGKIIAKAAQKYGFVVWDKAGSLSLRAENALSYTAIGKADPYPALYQNQPTYSVLNGFPWDKLQFLPFNYGKP